MKLTEAHLSLDVLPPLTSGTHTIVEGGGGQAQSFPWFPIPGAPQALLNGGDEEICSTQPEVGILLGATNLVR